MLDTLTDKDSQWCVAEPQAAYLNSRLTPQILNLKWRFVPAEELPCQHSDVLVESMVRDTLIRLEMYPIGWTGTGRGGISDSNQQPIQDRPDHLPQTHLSYPQILLRSLTD